MQRPTQGIPEGLYPMRAVARLTGLSPDVIRVWERRYGAVEPARTRGHARRYSAAEVRRLILLHEATRQGHSIGDIARLPDSRLEELAGTRAMPASEVPTSPVPDGDSLKALVESYLDDIARFQDRRAHETLSRAAALLPPTVFVLGVILPILREVGDRWVRQELGIAHEHVVSGHVKGFLTGLLRLAPAPPPGAPRLLAATPQGQPHEFGALMAAFLAAANGWDVTYAGPDIPPDDLVQAAEGSGAHVVVLSVLYVPTGKEMQRLAEDLKALSRRLRLWVGIPPDHPLRALVRGIRLFDRLEDLVKALNDLRQDLQAPRSTGI